VLGEWIRGYVELPLRHAGGGEVVPDVALRGENRSVVVVERVSSVVGSGWGYHTGFQGIIRQVQVVKKGRRGFVVDGEPGGRAVIVDRVGKCHVLVLLAGYPEGVVIWR